MGSAGRTSPRPRWRACGEGKQRQGKNTATNVPPPSPGAHMKLLIICFVSSELRELAKLMKEQ